MKLIGFNFTNISAKKEDTFKSKPSISTNIEFTNVSTQKVDLLKENDPLNVSFKFTINYTNGDEKKEVKYGQIVLEGNIIIISSEEESKEILKSWKKKALPPALQAPLFNLILKRCATKALLIEEDLGLPPHIPIPQVKLSTKKE